MMIEGRLTKDGRWWLAELPILDGLTQGRTRHEALTMAGDWVVTMAEQVGLKIDVVDAGGDRFLITADKPHVLIALVLRRRREASGLSLAQVAKKMGAQSRNSYARYERGQASPSVAKLAELLHAVDPKHDLALTIG